MSSVSDSMAAFPTPLDAYLPVSDGGLMATLVDRIAVAPFNAVATGIFALAILHTFAAARFTMLAHAAQHRADSRSRAAGWPVRPSVLAELLHFLGEVEVVFGLWTIPLLVAIVAFAGWGQATHYLNDTVNYTEPLFVIVIMAIASGSPCFLHAVLRTHSDAALMADADGLAIDADMVIANPGYAWM